MSDTPGTQQKYSPPKLDRFGSLAELTAGGSGLMAEGGNSGNMDMLGMGLLVMRP